MRRPRGFSLIEIMIAMTILSITLGGFAALTFRYIRSVESNSSKLATTAAMNEQVGRYTVMPFDTLANKTGCVTVTTGPVAHTRCVTLATVASKHQRVTIVITPTNPRVRPDTIVFDRTKPPTGALTP